MGEAFDNAAIATRQYGGAGKRARQAGRAARVTALGRFRALQARRAVALPGPGVGRDLAAGRARPGKAVP